VSEIRICNCTSALLSITYLKQQILYVVDSKQKKSISGTLFRLSCFSLVLLFPFLRTPDALRALHTLKCGFDGKTLEYTKLPFATNSEAFWSRSRGWARKSGARTAYVLHHSRDKYAVPASLPQKAACYGIGMPTVPELARVINHFPLIFFAVPSRSTWLFAVQKGRPVAGFTDTSK
jgi:hypothetical protein